jgi:hypothetical protein
MTTTATDLRVANLRETADQLDAVADPTTLFGPATPATVATARATYHRLAAATHPDRAAAPGNPLEVVANRAFCRLNELWTDWLATATPPTGATGIILDTGRRRYRLGERIGAGDVCDLFAATELDAPPDEDRRLAVKMARAPGDNDLLVTEAKALARLGRGPRHLRPYVPTLVDSLRHRDEVTGTDRRVNVLRALEGFVGLAEVKDAYPDGLDARDAAWMWRRTLVALGFLHREGIVHGAVVPEHVMIHPEMHGVVLVDFCFAAVHPVRRLVAVPPDWRDWYPADVLATRRADPALDLVLAARLFEWLIEDRPPLPVRRFLHGCLATPKGLRATDAWRLLGELDALLEDLWGPRRFRPFAMPAPAHRGPRT